jgi:hypothetical protein
MNTLFLSLFGLLVFSFLIYLFANKFIRKNKDYVERYPHKKENEPFLEESLSTEEPVIIQGTLKESKPRLPKKEKSTNKKSSSSSGIGIEELPKVKKTSNRKSYNKKKKNSKKDKGDDLLLS